MAFPSDTGSKQVDIAAVWSGSRSAAKTLKNWTANQRNVVGGVLSTQVLSFSAVLARTKDQLTLLRNLGGVNEYVQSQINDKSIDIVAEADAVISAIDPVVNWIVANFPKDANGYVSAAKLNADGKLADRVIQNQDFETLNPLLDALIATID